MSDGQSQRIPRAPSGEPQLLHAFAEAYRNRDIVTAIVAVLFAGYYVYQGLKFAVTLAMGVLSVALLGWGAYQVALTVGRHYQEVLWWSGVLSVATVALGALGFVVVHKGWHNALDEDVGGETDG